MKETTSEIAIDYLLAVIPSCRCEHCHPNTRDRSRMIVCDHCGNKRCPHAAHHANQCTGSNESGQLGSAWGQHFNKPDRPGLWKFRGQKQVVTQDIIDADGYHSGDWCLVAPARQVASTVQGEVSVQVQTPQNAASSSEIPESSSSDSGFDSKPLGPCEVCWTNSWVPVPADDPDAQALKDGSGFVRCDHCWLDGYARSLREQLADAQAKLATVTDKLAESERSRIKLRDWAARLESGLAENTARLANQPKENSDAR